MDINGVIWSSGNNSRIGIRTYQTVYNETLVVEYMDIYFRTKYSTYDQSNNFSYQFYEGGAVSLGSIKINHTSNSAWSESNITYIGTVDGAFKRTKVAQTGTCKAWFSGFEYGDSSGTIQANFDVPTIPSYTVYYNADGGTNAPNNQTKWYGESLKISSTIPTKTGHEFLHWKDVNSSDTYSPGGTFSANKYLSLVAVWRANTYTVSYDANAGTNAPSNQTKTYGVNLTLSTSIPTRTNYNFLGWSTNKTATEPTYKSGDTYTTNASVTLYAVWELAYVKPRINNLKVYRCDSEGNMADDGEYAKITFDWATDKDGARYCAYYKKDNEDEYISCVGVDMSTTSGSVETFLIGASGNVKFDPDYAYSIKLNVTDSFGYNHEERILHATFFTFDVTEDGKNMSFGESAHDEEDEVLRFAFKTVDIAPKERLLYNGQPFEDYIKSIISTLL